MRAIQIEQFGVSVQMHKVPQPRPSPEEVLVEIHVKSDYQLEVVVVGVTETPL